MFEEEKYTYNLNKSHKTLNNVDNYELGGIFHGSPNKFDVFDISKSGESQGSLFGWGLYFTNSIDSAENYADSNLSSSFIIDGEVVKSNFVKYNDLGSLHESDQKNIENIVKEIIQSYEEEYSKYPDSSKGNIELIAQGKELLSKIQMANKIEFSKSRNLYHVTLFKGKKENLVKWEDVVNSKNLNILKDILYDEIGGIKIQTQNDSKNYSERLKELTKLSKVSFGSAYRYLSEIIGGDKELSLLLKKNGIDGIYYYGGGEGILNYVVFDEKDVTIDKIEAFADGGSLLLAPNGKPTNLTPEQYKLVRTPEFKGWFGDWENDPKNSSKVVDKNGEPLVVYHTTSQDFNSFENRKAYYFAKDNKYSIYLLTQIKKRPLLKTLACFLNIKNMQKFKEEIESNNIAFFLNSTSFKKQKPDGLVGLDATDLEMEKDLREKEIDNTTYVVFKSNQIKLADGTNTTFDVKNDDIRFKDGGSINIPNEFHGREAGGVLIYAKNTGKYLLVKRSEEVLEPNTWNMVAGKVDDGEKVHEAVVREVKEEIGYEINNLKLIDVFKKDDFTFYNYISIVEDEFVPTLNWESLDYKWVNLDEFLNLHFGLDLLLKKINIKEIKDNLISDKNSLKQEKMEKYTQEALAKGTEVEMEHAETIKNYMREGVSVREVAESIAKDHLEERADYYDVIEIQNLEDGGEAKYNLHNTFASGGRVSGSKYNIPNVRGGWTKEKIIKYLKDYSSDNASTPTLAKYISEFDSWQDFKENIYYHGTNNYIEKGLSPSIRFSERWAEQQGGGGYGERYFGISLTKRKRTAESFSGQSSSVSIYPVILKRDAKVIHRTDLQDASEIEEIIVELYEKGIDAVWIGGGEEELVVVNPYSIILYKKGVENHAVYGGFKSIALTDEKIKEIYDSSFEIWENYSEKNKLMTNREERDILINSVPKIEFKDGGGVNDKQKSEQRINYENGIKIAEFLGYKNIRKKGEYPLYEIPNSLDMDGDIVTFEPMWDNSFRYSWNWLMPVVEKIAEIPNFIKPNGLYSKLVDININIGNKSVKIQDSYSEYTPVFLLKEILYYEDSLISNTYNAVVEFIKWYNENKSFKDGGQTDAQQEKIAKVMHEFKHEELTTHGKTVTDPKQAIAIALSEAGVEKKKDGGRIGYVKSNDGNIKLVLGEHWYDRDSDVELVPISELVKMREFDRKVSPKFNQEESNRNINFLKSKIKDEGIKEPLIIEYSLQDNAVLLIEGNHRLNSAIDIGLEYFPARVVLKKYNGYKGNQKKNALPVSGVKPNEHNYVPSNLKPSQVGIQGTTPIFEEGGIIEGQLHSECEEDHGCGRKFEVGNNGHVIEAERDEAVIVSKAFEDEKEYTIEGTPSEIASAVNVIGGGKNFDSGAEIETQEGEKVETTELKEEAKDTDVEDKLESGSVIINRRSMADETEYKVTGTPKQIASAINSVDGNGVVIEEGAEIEKIDN